MKFSVKKGKKISSAHTVYRRRQSESCEGRTTIKSFVSFRNMVEGIPKSSGKVQEESERGNVCVEH